MQVFETYMKVFLLLEVLQFLNLKISNVNLVSRNFSPVV